MNRANDYSAAMQGSRSNPTVLTSDTNRLYNGRKPMPKKEPPLALLQMHKPSLFKKQEDDDDLAAVPPGFRPHGESVNGDQIFDHKDLQLFWTRETEEYEWPMGAERQRFMFGEKTPVTVSAAGQASEKGNAKHVVVPDMHKAAAVMRLPTAAGEVRFNLEHLDRTCSLAACYGRMEGMAPPEAVAKALHIRLLQRLWADRGKWGGEQIFTAVAGVLAALAGEQGAPVFASIALVVGTLVAVHTAGPAQAIVQVVGKEELMSCTNGEAAVVELEP